MHERRSAMKKVYEVPQMVKMEALAEEMLSASSSSDREVEIDAGEVL